MISFNLIFPILIFVLIIAFITFCITGKRSILVSYQIVIYTSIQSIPTSIYATPSSTSSAITSTTTSSTSLTLSPPITVQRTYSSISIMTIDLSDTPQVIYIKIISLPQHGSLYTSNTSIVKLKVNDISLLTLPSSSLSSLSMINNQIYTKNQIYYKSNSYYFSSPTMTWNGSLIYSRILLVDSFQYVGITKNSSKSVVITQGVSIKNLNDPTIIDIKKLYSSSSKVGIFLFIFICRFFF